MKLSTNPARGFTLIELMVTVSLVAVLAALAAPSLYQFASRNAVRALSSDFTSGVQRARLEAVNKNMCASICMSTNASDANPKCVVTGEDWARGWIVFTNPSCNSTITATDPTPGSVIAVRDSSGSRFTLNNLSSNSGLRSITFSSRGATTMGSTVGFTLNDSGPSADSKLNRIICVDSLGRQRSISTASSC
jgi:type IV fimbrial biogenesis protein FimT